MQIQISSPELILEMSRSNASRGQHGEATRGDGTELVMAWGPPKSTCLVWPRQFLLSCGHRCHEGMQVPRGQLH